MKEIVELKKSEILEILTKFPQMAPTDDASLISGLNNLRALSILRAKSCKIK